MAATRQLPTQQRAAALIEIARIAGRRFDDLVTDANPIQISHTFDLGADH